MKLEDIKTIGIMGAGVMGGGITQCLLVGGFKVIVRDLKDEILAKMKNTITDGRFGLKGSIQRGKLTQEQMDAAVARLTTTTKVEDLKNCDWIIEAIGGADPSELENKPLKLKVFTELDGIIKKTAIFASNTTSYTIADLAKATNRKDRFIGMHFFSPAPIMKAVEVIYPAEVTQDIVDTAAEMVKKIDKNPVRVKDVPGDTGFVANRIWWAAEKEARKIVEEGITTADEVNTAVMGAFNWPVGLIPKGTPGWKTGWQ